MYYRRLLVVGTVLASGVVAVPAQAGERVRWRDCPGGVGNVRCGDVEVPRDHRKPGGAKIRIRVARRPAAERRGTLVFLPGGPGQSGPTPSPR